MNQGNPVSRARGPRPAPSASGYTLVELLVVIFIISIVSAIAFPNFRGMVVGNRLTGAANEMVASLQIARTEAVRRNARTILCPSTDGTNCSGTDWGRHISFVDVNRNNAPDNGEVIRDTTVAAPTLVVASSAITGAAPAANNRIVFKPDGRARAGTAATAGILSGKLSVCEVTTNPANNARDVEIGTGSRISVRVRSGNGACAAPTNADA